MSDKQREATRRLLTEHPEHYQAVMRTWAATLTADDPETLADAIEAYLQACINSGDVIMREMEASGRSCESTC